MRILVIGSGGREHALAWKLASSPETECLLAAPGNPGMADVAVVVPGIDPEDPSAVVDLALANDVDLVVVGPEGPLAAGVVDALDVAGIPAFGPTAAAARLESSKSFAKEIMRRAGVATADGRTFVDADEAARYLAAVEPPYVVKADGLAAGKGVLVTEDLVAAQAWARFCVEGHLGERNRRVVVEEFLSGREVSIFALCDGTRALPFEPARDYKRLREGGEGPNTGGMGCYSPVDDLPDGLLDEAMDRVVTPVLDALAAGGVTYRGFLYAGLMLTDDGVKVLEFNCRMGDPEAEALLPRLDEDLVRLLADAASGGLPDRRLRWSSNAAVDVVLAAPGYPEAPRRELPISGLDVVARWEDLLVFHAGTRRTAQGLVTWGGRVLNLVGLGPDLETARRTAYEAAEVVDFEGKQYRRDIGR